MTQAQFDALKSTYGEGNLQGTLTVIEYSDPECLFCIRQSQDKTLATIMQEFGSQIQYVYKPVAGVNHPGTSYKSAAILCAGQQGGTDAYRTMYQKILEGSSLEEPLTIDQIPTIARDISKKNTNFSTMKRETCMKNSIKTL
jgi:protein-disulfide isomerase